MPRVLSMQSVLPMQPVPLMLPCRTTKLADEQFVFPFCFKKTNSVFLKTNSVFHFFWKTACFYFENSLFLF
jgi:hypothetical protein